MKFYKDTLEIIFFARAGQGAKSAAEILAQAAVAEGKHIQAFPYYGPERSGAPTKAYVRISSRPIRTHEPITDPDLVVVMDDTLLKTENVTKNLDENESLIVNTKKTEEEIRKLAKGFKGNIKTIDAIGIAEDTIGQPRPNGVMLGKIVSVIKVVKLENVFDQFRKIFEKKVGKAITQKNILAIERGHDSL
ncbi:MAG: 2-oxoacid:acceptor oxidoreductase family protein [Candidatus Moranbacteria bacterium]|jgi:pyruvate ferredoxin oxidoreductase gamma subunit|nr:2-oxoacid:acceptor oxidoreductase family protein [Candidatus Moranbacteria bacterium]MDD5652219.1 2-oxoacid:acceptor oxidoreductase family protein [Candidatus Moranbacteria bacterium]MDX9855409.1 2-oxoacid:acceptor oxidoreductase family protein [Candidatus Moranbacteria bacterium]